jgi:hypothetical protein
MVVNWGILSRAGGYPIAQLIVKGILMGISNFLKLEPELDLKTRTVIRLYIGPFSSCRTPCQAEPTLVFDL